MAYAIIILIVLSLIFILSSVLESIDKNDNKLINKIDREYCHFYFSEIPKDYHYYKMVGMYYRGITPNDFGVYNGYAVPEKNNKYDPYSIAIYRNCDNMHVGYLPAGNADLHRILTYRNGRANAIFRIQGSRERCYGDVYIEYKYKVFRAGNVLNPYLSRSVKIFPIITYDNYNGKIKCHLTTKFAKDEYDYTVTAIDNNNTPIGRTDDNQLQLFDYVNVKGNISPACCYINSNQTEGSLFVPLNYTEKTAKEKIEDFFNS